MRRLPCSEVVENTRVDLVVKERRQNFLACVFAKRSAGYREVQAFKKRFLFVPMMQIKHNSHLFDEIVPEWFAHRPWKLFCAVMLHQGEHVEFYSSLSFLLKDSFLRLEALHVVPLHAPHYTSLTFFELF